MKRRTMIGGMMAAAVAAPVGLRADEISDWAAWWERSKRYTLQIAEAMPAADYSYVPFGAATAEGVKSGDGARSFGLRGRAVKVEAAGFPYLPRGTILHWEFRHWVVLERLGRDGARVVDPAGGRRWIPIAD